MQLGLKFPEDSSAHAVLDVALYEEQELTTADGDTYPLVIRMETITDKGKADGHTLQVPRYTQHISSIQHVVQKLLFAQYSLAL